MPSLTETYAEAFDEENYLIAIKNILDVPSTFPLEGSVLTRGSNEHASPVIFYMLY